MVEEALHWVTVLSTPLRMFRKNAISKGTDKTQRCFSSPPRSGRAIARPATSSGPLRYKLKLNSVNLLFVVPRLKRRSRKLSARFVKTRGCAASHRSVKLQREPQPSTEPLVNDQISCIPITTNQAHRPASRPACASPPMARSRGGGCFGVSAARRALSLSCAAGSFPKPAVAERLKRMRTIFQN